MDIASLISLIVALTALAVVALPLSPIRSKRSLVKRTVIVHTKDGQSVRGVLCAHHSDRLTLTEAFYLTDKQAELPIDGLAHVPRSNVAWIQELPKAE